MAEASAPNCEVYLSEAASRFHTAAYLAAPGSGDPLDLTAFVSCYNEADFILQTLDDICAALKKTGLRFEIIVIDDRSRDDSSEKVRGYISQHPEVPIILRRNLVNRGLAQNYIDAAFLGKGRYYKLFCGDNTEPISTIVEICRHIGEADIVIPHYSSVEGKSRFRQWLSRSFTNLVNLISGRKLNYYNGLSVNLRYNIMRWHPNTRGFGFQADIICMLLDNGATHLEVPVPAINRAESRALTIKNILSVGHTLLDILIRRVAGKLYG